MVCRGNQCSENDLLCWCILLGSSFWILQSSFSFNSQPNVRPVSRFSFSFHSGSAGKASWTSFWRSRFLPNSASLVLEWFRTASRYKFYHSACLGSMVKYVCSPVYPNGPAVDVPEPWGNSLALHLDDSKKDSTFATRVVCKDLRSSHHRDGRLTSIIETLLTSLPAAL